MGKEMMMGQQIGQPQQGGGLSAQLAGGMADEKKPAEMDTINEIVALLKEGMDPQELIDNGIPEELVREAMEELAAQSNQVEGGDTSGLSGMLAQQPQRAQ